MVDNTETVRRAFKPSPLQRVARAWGEWDRQPSYRGAVVELQDALTELAAEVGCRPADLRRAMFEARMRWVNDRHTTTAELTMCVSEAIERCRPASTPDASPPPADATPEQMVLA